MYNLVHMYKGSLPWENVEEPEIVKMSKIPVDERPKKYKSILGHFLEKAEKKFSDDVLQIKMNTNI